MEGGKKSPGKPIQDYENLTDQRPINLTEQSTLFAPWEICMQVKKQQLEPYMEQWAGSKLGKEYVRAVYWHPAYLTYMQSTSWEMQDWRKPKLINNLRYYTTLMAEREEQVKSLLKVKEESEKAGLKLNIQKTKLTAS